jgi:FKBP-type peptidyl-prolyl cis-trans isomerase
MKKYFAIAFFVFAACAKQQTYPPAGIASNENDLNVSKIRTKNLNEEERRQIETWIKNQDKKFYPMELNYWTDIENTEKNTKKKDGESVSYQYDLYDFNMTKWYEKPKERHNVQLGHFEEIKAVVDALRYMKKGQEATLLVPSVLAFGAFGDNDQIPNDMPLIIKLKVL